MSIKIGMSFTGSNTNTPVYKKPKIALSGHQVTPQAILRSGTAALNFQRSNSRPATLGATNLGNIFRPKPSRGCGCGG